MAKVAYALKESYELEGFEGGASVAGGEGIDVGERLRKGKGFIITDNPMEIEVLDPYDALKRVSLEDAKSAQKGQSRDADAATTYRAGGRQDKE